MFIEVINKSMRKIFWGFDTAEPERASSRVNVWEGGGGTREVDEAPRGGRPRNDT
jgi:hypothetical protein